MTKEISWVCLKERFFTHLEYKIENYILYQLLIFHKFDFQSDNFNQLMSRFWVLLK